MQKKSPPSTPLFPSLKRILQLAGRNRTWFFIAMESGRVVEQGCHAELVEEEGLYRKLYQLQFKDSTVSPP